jgi:DNA polymerase III psi subunit
MDRVELTDGRSFLMATPEKALADRIVADRGAGISTRKELLEYLLTTLRIDPAGLRTLAPERMTEIARHYRSRRVRLLADLASRPEKSGTGVR